MLTSGYYKADKVLTSRYHTKGRWDVKKQILTGRSDANEQIRWQQGDKILRIEKDTNQRIC